MELQLVDGVSMTDVVLQTESSLISSAGGSEQRLTGKAAIEVRS